MTDTTSGSNAASGTAIEPSLHRVMGPWLLLLFIVGDILGTGIYALTGQVAKQVGGVVWLPFLVAFIVAVVTAFSYLELVTKYPKAAGAALYTHKAFGIHFVTFIVAFTVMCSGITSASTASRAFAANLSGAFQLNLETGVGITLVALGFMALVAAVNFRGVGESVKANVVLTVVELTGLLIIIFIGLWAIFGGQGDVSRITQFATTPELQRLLVRHGRHDPRLLRHGGIRRLRQYGRGMQKPVRHLPKSSPRGSVHNRGNLCTGIDIGDHPSYTR